MKKKIATSVIVAQLLIGASMQVNAYTFTVNTWDANSSMVDCTLRDAVHAANNNMNYNGCIREGTGSEEGNRIVFDLVDDYTISQGTIMFRDSYNESNSSALEPITGKLMIDGSTFKGTTDEQGELMPLRLEHSKDNGMVEKFRFIDMTDANLTIKNIDFFKGQKGAIRVVDSVFTLEESLISGNEGAPGMFVEGSDLHLHGVDFVDNKYSSGGIVAMDSNLSIDNAAFSRNHGIKAGGIYQNSGRLTMNESLMKYNDSNEGGRRTMYQ